MLQEIGLFSDWAICFFLKIQRHLFAFSPWRYLHFRLHLVEFWRTQGYKNSEGPKGCKILEDPRTSSSGGPQNFYIKLLPESALHLFAALYLILLHFLVVAMVMVVMMMVAQCCFYDDERSGRLERTMFIGVALQSSCPGWRDWSLLYVISVSISDQLLTICWLCLFLTPPTKTFFVLQVWPRVWVIVGVLTLPFVAMFFKSRFEKGPTFPRPTLISRISDA